jgi:hypothetical protein
MVLCARFILHRERAWNLRRRYEVALSAELTAARERQGFGLEKTDNESLKLNRHR